MAIQIRRGTKSGWDSNKSNIVAGEPAIATDTGEVFVGTGSGSFVELARIDTLAPTFSSSAVYSAGEYVNYNGEIYQFTVGHTGAWVASHATKVTVGGMLKDTAYMNFETTTASGDIATFSNGAGEIPVRELKANIVATQSGSGDPSPSNVRTINGFSSVTVNVSGKNMLKEHFVTTTRTLNGVTWTLNPDGSVTTSGTATANSQPMGARFKLPLGSYILSGCPSGGSGTSHYLRLIQYVEGTSTSVTSASDYGAGATFTVTRSDVEVLVFANIPNGTTLNATWYPMIRLSTETDSTYDKYVGNNYTTSLGSTYYGGVLNVTTGVLTVTHEAYSFTGSETVSSSSVGGHTRFNVGGVFPYNANNDTPVIEQNLCSHFLSRATPLGSNATNNAMSAYNTSLYWRADQFADATAMKNYLLTQKNNGTPVTYVATLATPQTYQLSPMQVRTVLGDNNIWANSGSVEVTYRISNAV